MVRETHTAAATTVDSEEVAGDGLLEEHLLPGDLLVRGDELLEDGDHVTMPAGVSCFSEMVKGERSTSTSMTMMCLGLAQVIQEKLSCQKFSLFAKFVKSFSEVKMQ